MDSVPDTHRPAGRSEKEGFSRRRKVGEYPCHVLELGLHHRLLVLQTDISSLGQSVGLRLLLRYLGQAKLLCGSGALLYDREDAGRDEAKPDNRRVRLSEDGREQERRKGNGSNGHIQRWLRLSRTLP